MPRRHYSVALRDVLEDDEMPLGRIAIDETTGEVILTGVLPDMQDLMQAIADEVNALENFEIKSPPPGGTGDRGIWRRTASRTDADFAEAIRDLLEQSHALIFEPLDFDPDGEPPATLFSLEVETEVARLPTED